MRVSCVSQLARYLCVNKGLSTINGVIIISQDSLEVNPSVLICCFLVGVSPYGPFPWERSEAVYFFVFESRQIQKFQLKLRKENLLYSHSSQRNYLKDWYFTELDIMDKEEEYSPSEFYYPEGLETSNLETETGRRRRKSGGQRRFYKQTKKCKHK